MSALMPVSNPALNSLPFRRIIDDSVCVAYSVHESVYSTLNLLLLCVLIVRETQAIG